MRTISLLPPAGLLLATGIVLAAGARPAPAGSAPLLKGRATSGAAVAVPVAGARLTVVALTSTTCPLCLRYGPTLARLEDAYRARGVRFVFVNPEPDADAGATGAAARRLGLSGPMVHDAGWARKLGAKTTTETFVLDAVGKVRYRGAVDDQYAIGSSRPSPKHRYLALALDSLLAGKSPAVTRTPAPGCFLALAGAAEPAVPAYHGGVEAIVQKNCLACHREGGPAPFSLATYAQVKARAPMIKYVVEQGIMPPWFASKEAGAWRNDRTLSAGDRAKLLAWADQGTPKGDPKRATKPPAFVSGWTIDKPDAVFQLPKPVAVQAEGTMPYEIVDVPTGIAEDRWVREIEIVPGARRVVHHVLVFARKPTTRSGKNSGETEDAEGLGGFFAGYVPGQSALRYPAGYAKRLPKGAVLRFQIHYTPNGEATTDRTKVGVVWAEKPEHEVHTLGLANVFLSIPPGAANHRVAAELTSPVDAEILSFLPHMHVRGKAARYEIARREGGKTVRTTLLDVPKYDFNWQLNYVAATPIPVRRGDRIVYTAWYDNSEANRANPDPKRRVGWGEQTFDEMMLGYIEYVIPGVTP